MSEPEGSGAQTAPAASPGGVRPLLRMLMIASYGLAILVGAFIPLAGMRWIGLPHYFAATQDMQVAVALVVAMLATALVLWRGRAVRVPLPEGRWATGAAAIGVLGVAALGALILDGGFALSHDEIMLVEEARLFLTGRLAAPVPPEWQPFLYQMFPFYVRTSLDGTLLSSAYYPGSAAIHALFEAAGAGALANPVLAAGSVLLTAALALRIFPGRQDLAVLAALLLASSAQFVVTAMTSFAMTEHLFLNLAWLVLFLRDTRRAHAAAMLVGAVAIVQHHMHVHPLFALPFLADLVLRRRRWALAGAYATVYAAVLAGCLGWRGFVLGGPALNMMRGSAEASGLSMILTRIFSDAGEGGGAKLLAFALWNLFRFVLWQNPLAILLAILGLGALRRGPRELKLLAAGIPLALLPNLATGIYDQGFGWGYRYLHVHLASLCLLAAFGAAGLQLRARDAAERLRLRTGFALIGLVAGLAVLGWRIADFGGMILPYRAADAAIRAMPADVVLTSHDALVRNDFGFAGRPKVMAYRLMDPAGLETLCRRGSVVMLPPEFTETYGIGRWDPWLEPTVALREYRHARARLEVAGCD